MTSKYEQPANHHPRAVGGSAGERQTFTSRVHDLIRSDIRTGTLPQDSVLVEDRLVVSLAASRASVREALQQLAGEGLVARSPRLGTRVVENIIQMPIDDIRPIGVLPGEFRVECTDRRRVPSTPLMRQRLGTKDLEVGFVEHYFLMRNEPVGIRAVYHRLGIEQPYSWAECPSLAEGFAFVFGVALRSIASTVDSVAADGKTAELLGVAIGSPVLLLEQVLVDANGVCQEFTFTRYRADRVSLSGLNYFHQCETLPG